MVAQGTTAIVHPTAVVETLNAEVVLRTAAIDRDGSGFVDLEEFIDWWFRDKLTMKAKMEAKQKPPRKRTRSSARRRPPSLMRKVAPPV